MHLLIHIIHSLATNISGALHWMLLPQATMDFHLLITFYRLSCYHKYNLKLA